MSNLMNKMLSLVGFDSGNEYEDAYNNDRQEYEDEAVYDESPAMERFASRRSSRVVKLHENTSQQMRVVVIQPRSFEEAQDIADHLKDRKPVIMNLEAVESAVSRKIVDFLSGATYALDGNMQKITNGIFLVAPNNVGILDQELTAKSSFPWGN